MRHVYKKNKNHTINNKIMMMPGAHKKKELSGRLVPAAALTIMIIMIPVYIYVEEKNK